MGAAVAEAWTVPDFGVKVAFHAMWLSPLSGFLYLGVYEGWHSKPHWVLGMYLLRSIDVPQNPSICNCVWAIL